jgi:hypothetical protein
MRTLDEATAPNGETYRVKLKTAALGFEWRVWAVVRGPDGRVVHSTPIVKHRFRRSAMKAALAWIAQQTAPTTNPEN